MNKPLPPVDYDDNPEWTDADFARAKPAPLLTRKRGRPIGSSKQQIALRIDVDVLAAFKAGGPGWQTRMNDALRKAVEA